MTRTNQLDFNVFALLVLSSAHLLPQPQIALAPSLRSSARARVTQLNKLIRLRPRTSASMAPSILPTSSASSIRSNGGQGRWGSDAAYGGGAGGGADAYALPRSERGVPLVLRRLLKFKSMVSPPAGTSTSTKCECECECERRQGDGEARGASGGGERGEEGGKGKGEKGREGA